MNTRRNFMRGLSGIGAIVATGHAPAIVKSMIAARGTMLGGAHGWRNPYITDGLIAMWDGEWNAGGGVHDPNATVWKDLVGNNDLPLTQSSNLYFDEKSLVAKNGVYAGFSRNDYPVDLVDFTFEVCWSRDTLFSVEADSSNKFGLLTADVFKGKIFVKANTINRVDYTPVGVSQGDRFAISFSGKYNGDSRDIIAYLNNRQLVGGVTMPGNYSASQLRIGSGWNNPSSHHFNVRIYSRALTAYEIAANYAVNKKRFNLAS